MENDDVHHHHHQHPLTFTPTHRATSNSLKGDSNGEAAGCNVGFSVGLWLRKYLAGFVIV